MVGKLLLTILLSVTGLVHAEELPLFGDPALLLDNANWLAKQNKFRELGGETRSYLDLVTILYDWDLQRPWGKNYVPQANGRLSKFREKVCPELPHLPICSKPLALTNAKEVGIAQAALLDGNSIKALEARWSLAITPWFQPGQMPLFNMIAAQSRREESVQTAYWDMRAEQVQLSVYEDEFLPDVLNYRAGFENKDAPALMALNPSGPAINDRHLKQRAVDLAEAWKRAIESNRRRMPEHVLAGASEVQFQKLYDTLSSDFESTYQSLLTKVESLPKIKERFLKERSDSGYPGEVYQHVAYKHLKELVYAQAAYFAQAHTQRANLSARQKALESLLTLQRYNASTQAFAMEMMTLLEPFSSHGFALDQNADNKIAMTYTLENLRAALGLGLYEGKGLFETHGKGLANDVLFDNMNIENTAPEVADLLKGRKIADLKPHEQLEVLQAYLEPVPGQVRAQALLRLGTLFWLNAEKAELKILAENIHERFYGAKPMELTLAQ